MNELLTTFDTPLPPLEQARRDYAAAKDAFDAADTDETGQLQRRLNATEARLTALENEAMRRAR